MQRIIDYFQKFLQDQNLRPTKYIKQLINLIDKYVRNQMICQKQYKHIKIIKKFLISSFQTFLIENRQLFPQFLNLLNSVLKSNKNTVIYGSKSFLISLNSLFKGYLTINRCFNVIQNVIWLVLKIFKMAYNKHQTFYNIYKSKILYSILQCTQYNEYTKKGTKVLIIMLLNSNSTFDFLVEHLSLNLTYDRSKDEFISLILQAISQFKLNFEENSLQKLENCLQIYKNRQQININQRLINYNIISIRLYSKRQKNLQKVIDNIISILQNYHERYLKIADQIIKIVQAIQFQTDLIKKVMKQSGLTMHKNEISMRIIFNHRKLLDNAQLITILSSSLPKDLIILLNNRNQVHKVLKIILFLKICVNNNGLQRIFYYAFKDLLQKISEKKSIYKQISGIQQFLQMIDDVIKEYKQQILKL